MEPTFWKRAQDALVPMPVERTVSEWAVRETSPVEFPRDRVVLAGESSGANQTHPFSHAG